jgi:hypothetical protein
MDNLTTSQRMRSHIIITLIVLWAISERYGAGFSLVNLGLAWAVIPNWAIFLVLGIGIIAAQRHRAAVLGPIRAWLGWVLVGEEEQL